MLTEDVLRLEVSMRHAVRVYVRQALGRLLEQHGRDVGVEVALVRRDYVEEVAGEALGQDVDAHLAVQRLGGRAGSVDINGGARERERRGRG